MLLRDAPAVEKMHLAIADARDRESIYRIRHDVYARELGQYGANDAGRLTDDLDALNTYFVVRQQARVLGFVSITPPGGRYSIDKYVNRDELPFVIDDSVYEVRILTVRKEQRLDRRGIALLLMLAALRWIEARGGRRIIAIGRLEVLGLYRKMGLRPFGRRVSRGAVTFELMTATTDELDTTVRAHERTFRGILQNIDWPLDTPAIEPPACFHGGAFFDAIGPCFDDLSRRRDIINADVLDAWFAPSPMVLDRLRQHLPWLVRTSPPAGCQGLLEVIAAARGVPRDALLPGAGSSDLIFRALRHWLTPSSRALILDPTYGEYAHVLERVIGCRVERLRLRRDHAYQLDITEFQARARDRFDLIVLVNPNSPTGTYVSGDTMARLLEHVPATTRVWVDETYIDYVDARQSIERLAAGSANIFVCKSLSKVYALSGMRAAYLCGPQRQITQLGAITPPWVIGLPAQVAAVAALQDPRYYQHRYEQTHQLRDELARRLSQQFGWSVAQNVANFLLVHLPDDGPDAATIVRQCRARGLFLRDASTMGRAMGDRTLRIAVKNEAENARMVDILAEASVIFAEPAVS